MFAFRTSQELTCLARGHEDASKTLQEVPKSLQGALKMPQVGLKLAHDGPPQGGFKVSSCWLHSWGKIAETGTNI